MLRGDARQHADPIQVVSAFQVPRVKYDPIRRSFYLAHDRTALAPDRAPLLGVAQARSCPERLRYIRVIQPHNQATLRSSRKSAGHDLRGALLLHMAIVERASSGFFGRCQSWGCTAMPHIMRQELFARATSWLPGSPGSQDSGSACYPRICQHAICTEYIACGQPHAIQSCMHVSACEVHEQGKLDLA